MNIACSTCLERFTPNCDISSTMCGHIFHTDCINTWIKKGHKSCPQCRQHCTPRKIHKIYFSETVEVSNKHRRNDNQILPFFVKHVVNSSNLMSTILSKTFFFHAETNKLLLTFEVSMHKLMQNFGRNIRLKSGERTKVLS